MDYEKFYTLGEAGKYINTVCEIPKGSHLKVEYNVKTLNFELDRVEPSIYAKPTSYGFIPQTIDEDGDALDTLIITDEPVPMGLVVRARVIGILNFVDDGENDHKIVCVPEDERETGDAVRSLDDLTDQFKKQITEHFNHYKDLKKPGSTVVEGWGNESDAWKIIQECSERYVKSK